MKTSHVFVKMNFILYVHLMKILDLHESVQMGLFDVNVVQVVQDEKVKIKCKEQSHLPLSFYIYTLLSGLHF